MDSDKLNRVILFQAGRRLKNVTSEFLTTLEARIIYLKQLEATLTRMGVGEYENSPIDYQKDRKRFLDILNLNLRELQEIEKLID
jgi:hypothetical protein